ncbi:vWA domain-containing protein [Streptomyces sp. NPDC052396]|uniref:vWA domain-containing protein n=1 Tax=Streptomyces sp. NPDC052396 TaxID=3365689 RepID=UPI0037D7A7BA
MGIRSLLRNAFGRARTADEQQEPNLPQQSAASPTAPTAPAPAPAPASAPASVPAQPAGDRVPDPGPLEPTPSPAPGEPVPEPEPRPRPMPEPQPVPEPDGPSPIPEPSPVPEPETEPAPAGAAISLEKVRQAAPGLVSLYKTAGVSLHKQGLAGQRAAVYLVLDRSGSMREYYKNGSVQHLAEQVLGLSANLDDDGTVPVVFFSTEVDGIADLDLTNYAGRIQHLHESYGHMGRTNYAAAMRAVIDHYRDCGATDPAFVVFQTDGGPISKAQAERVLCEAAGLPIFWQFVAFGEPGSKGFDFLRSLEALPVPERRAVDNAGFFHAGRDPHTLADDRLYQELTAEFPAWLSEARAAGIIRGR